MTWTQDDYWKLHVLFHTDFAGYRPNVKEIPNGDGKIDEGKRYLHISTRHWAPDFAKEYLSRAYAQACEYASMRGVSEEYYPDLDACALRVLEYPPGAGSHPHTDLDMFTINLWRNIAPFKDAIHIGEIGEMIGLGKAHPHYVPAREEYQYALVFFALPKHTTKLPDGRSVGEYLTERLARSRVVG